MWSIGFLIWAGLTTHAQVNFWFAVDSTVKTFSCMSKQGSQGVVETLLEIPAEIESEVENLPRELEAAVTDAFDGLDQCKKDIQEGI